MNGDTQARIELEVVVWAWWRSFRQALPGWRREAGLNQRELARILGTTQGNISSDESPAAVDEVWGITRTISWLRALGRRIVATSAEGEEVTIDSWGPSRGRWIASQRELAGLSQVRLADIIGRAVSTIQAIEHRGSEPRATIVVASLLACNWALDVRLGDRAELPVSPAPGEDTRSRKAKARGRAMTRLGREYPGEYQLQYKYAQATGGTSTNMTAQRARDAALAELRSSHTDRFRELYREELTKVL